MQISPIRFIRIVAVFGVTFTLVLELCARLDDLYNYGAPLWSAYSYSSLYLSDEEGIRHNRPNARFEKWKINNLGFRGEDLEASKPDGIIRIVCLGTSETFGLYESRGGEWPARLAAIAREHALPVQVINGSVVGLGAEKRRAYLDKYILPLEPDIIILHLGFWEEARSGAPSPPPVRASESRRRRSGPGLWATVTGQIRFLPKLRSGLKAHLPPELVERIAIWQATSDIRRREEAVLGTRPPRDGVPHEAIRIFRRRVEELVEYIRGLGITPVLSTSPCLIDRTNRHLFLRELMDYRRFVVELSEKGMAGAPELFNDCIREVAADKGVLFVDNAALVPKSREYFGDLIHYTDKGAALIARSYFGLLRPSLPPVNPSQAGNGR